MTDRLMSLIPGAPMPELSTPPVPSQPMMMVEVVNRNGFTIRDMFDGVPYTFRPNQPLSIPPQVANHLFGWPGEGEQMRLHTCRRLGWNTAEHMERDKNRPHDLRSVADIYFENIDIKTVEYDMVKRERSSSDVPMPEDSELAERPEMDARAEAGDRPMGGDPTGETRMGHGRHSKPVVRMDL
jgi:hypothetical protein